MSRSALALSLLLAFGPGAHADTLHAIADGAYWHHDSGWIMPERIGEFVRVGMPQDVAGSTDVIVYYARATGERVTASVEVYRQDSAINDKSPPEAKASFEAELGAVVSLQESELIADAGAVTARVNRIVFASDVQSGPRWLLYFASAGDWRVKVRITSPSPQSQSLALADAFVRGLRWDSLGRTATQ